MVNAWHAVGFVAGAAVGVAAEKSIAIPAGNIPTWLVQAGEVVLGGLVVYGGMKLDSGEVGSVVTGIGIGYAGSAVASAIGF